MSVFNMIEYISYYCYSHRGQPVCSIISHQIKFLYKNVVSFLNFKNKLSTFLSLCLLVTFFPIFSLPFASLAGKQCMVGGCMYYCDFLHPTCASKQYLLEGAFIAYLPTRFKVRGHRYVIMWIF